MSRNLQEPKMRLEVVSEQRYIEDSVAKSKKGVAIFVVPSPLTPMFISPDVVTYDEKDSLFKLKPTAPLNAIPQGLIPSDKMADAKQLSTVLGRVVSVNAMLQAGTKIVVLYAGDRIKADSKEELVADEQVKLLAQKYPDTFLLKQIKPQLYAEYKDKVCAATYNYLKHDQEIQVGIDATQIHKAGDSHDWGIRREEEAQQKSRNLDNLLKHDQVSLPSIRELNDVKTIQTKTSISQSHQLMRFGVFGTIASAAAYVAFKLLTKGSTSSSSQGFTR